MLLVYGLRKRKLCRRLCRVLSPFRCVVCFWSSIFVDNMTYLSFKCFLQLDRFVPYAHGNSSLISACCCITMLFLLIFTVCGIGSVGWVFSKIFCVDNFKRRSFKGYLYLTVMVASKFGAGFCHAYVNDPQIRSLGLLTLNISTLIGLLFCWKGMEFRFYRVMHFWVSVFKVGLHLRLLL